MNQKEITEMSNRMDRAEQRAKLLSAQRRHLENMHEAVKEAYAAPQVTSKHLGALRTQVAALDDLCRQVEAHDTMKLSAAAGSGNPLLDTARQMSGADMDNDPQMQDLKRQVAAHNRK